MEDMISWMQEGGQVCVWS